MAVLTLVLMPAVRLLTQNVTKVVMEPVSSILPLTLLITTLVLHYHLMVNWVSLNPEQQDATNATTNTQDGSGASGAGGSLYLSTNSLTNSGSITANGGAQGLSSRLAFFKP